MGSIIGSVGGLAGSIIGQNAAGSDRGHAQALTDEAINAINGVAVPTDLANAINLRQYQSAGQLTPAQEQTINAAPSQAGQVKGNAQLQNAQMQALNALQAQSQTGMSSADRARLNQIQQQMATQAEGQRQAVLQNFAQRGLAGSGNELLAQLQASQNAANQANQQGLGVAGQAQQNALQALSQYGNQAGAMEGQQFNQQTQAAQAQDLLNRFNVQNQQQQQARNVGMQNAAQQYNLQNQQGIQNANVGQANAELQRQKAAEQQQFQDALSKGQALSGASFTGANAYTNMGNQIAQNWQNIGSGVGNILGGGFTQNSSGSSPFGSALGSLFGSGGSGGMESSSGPVGDFGSVVPGSGSYGDIAPGSSPFDVGTMVAAKGGEVPAYSFGGKVPQSEDKYVRTYGNGFDAPNNYTDGGEVSGVHSNGLSNGVQSYAVGGDVPLTYPTLTVGPKPQPPPPQQSGGGGGDMMSSAMSMLPMLAMLASKGGPVPGKAKVPGDSYENDTVPARLSPKEIVLPRSVTLDQDAPDKAKKFVERIKNSKKE